MSAAPGDPNAAAGARLKPPHPCAIPILSEGA
jgi:hypothetical protein